MTIFDGAAREWGPAYVFNPKNLQRYNTTITGDRLLSRCMCGVAIVIA
jgi:hypothetical protein